MPKQREEVLNVTLARILSALGVSAAPETVQQGFGSGLALPDVLIEYRGARIAIEGKFKDVPKAAQKVRDQAHSRISSGIAQLALAVQYPADLRACPFDVLVPRLGDAALTYCAISEAGEDGHWHDGNVSDVLDEVRRAHERMCQEDIVQRAAESIKGCLDGVAKILAANKQIGAELSSVLGITPPAKEDPETRERRIETVTRIAALTLENAFIFQEQLAGSGVENVSTLNQLLQKTNAIGSALKTWTWISENINYVPIFRLACEILQRIPSTGAANGAVRVLAEKAVEVSSNEAALRHDLMGRIYHYLLHEAKYLGTYYTSVPAATMLAKLALNPKRWASVDFNCFADLRKLRVADLTCGTGTLLMAACQAVSDNFVVGAARRGSAISEKSLSSLHATLMEHVMHGYDVLPSAIHLTASTLSLLAPEVLFHKLHLYSMPLGVKNGVASLGSLEFIGSNVSQTQLSLFDVESADTEARRYTAEGMKGSSADIPPTDLFLMNPPFTRSVGDNLLFGNLPEDKRAVMQRELKARVQQKRLSANITAGLGSVFFAMANNYLKQDGRAAFVLPAALTSGIAWEETRKLLQTQYHLEFVLISHDAARWNFSENTDLSEIMFVARKLRENESNAELATAFVNLWRNPTNAGDALAVTRLIEKAAQNAVDSASSLGTAEISEPGTKYGEVMAVQMATLSEGWWPTAFAQTHLTRIAHSLRGGELCLPGMKKRWPVPICRLFQIAELGPDRRDIHDGFEVVTTPTPYRAFWNHDAQKTFTIGQKSNAYLSPRSKPAPGRDRVRDVRLLWPKAGSLLLSERLRFNTQRLTAVLLDRPVLTNTWWPVTLRKPDKKKEKALALWQNSSLGLCLLAMNRIVSEGSWVQFKKPSLQLLPILNVDALEESQLHKMATHYDGISKLEFASFSKMTDDDVRTAADLAVATTLGLPDLTPLRELLSLEPVFTNKSIALDDKPVRAITPQLELLFA
jgi:type I restriction-modification system DNA methylase subunit